MKAIPNKHIQKCFAETNWNDNFDGELIVGAANSGTVMRDTTSGVMSHEKIPDFAYHIFDIWSSSLAYKHRLEHMQGVKGLLPPWCQVVPATLAKNPKQILDLESVYLEMGYEGVILRNPDSHYKQGRTTLKENNSFKMKRFSDAEATIIGWEPEYLNTNPAETNELGRTKRSTMAVGMKAKERLGALVVKMPNFGVFNIGSGFDQKDRINLWERREELIGKTAKFKYFDVGVKDKPRHPIFLGFRDMEIDG
jgi:DNA ligase-1